MRAHRPCRGGFGRLIPTPAPLAPFAAQWGFTDETLPLLRQALTHTSMARRDTPGNERLEFLGDALLGAWVARYLFTALPPDTAEDTLTRARTEVIRGETLAHAARQMGLSDLLVVGQGERKERRHTHDGLLADAFEALAAAIFLAQGEDALAAFLTTALADPLARVVAAPPPPDPKTRLQERLQATGRGLPTYHTREATGAGHDHHFVVEVVAEDGAVLGQGAGPNKRTAGREAALAALSALDW